MKIDIQTTASQQMTCDEIEKFVKAHIGGVRTSLDEPVGGYDAPFPIDEGYSLPTSIQMSDGIYLDTKQKLQAQGINVTLGTEAKEYVRVLDEEVLSVLKQKGIVSGDKATLTECSSYKVVYNVLYIFEGNSNVNYFNAFRYFTSITKIGNTGNKVGGVTFSKCSLKVLSIPASVTEIGYYGGVASNAFTNTFLEEVHVSSVLHYLSINIGTYYTCCPLHSGKAKLCLYDSDVAITDIIVPSSITRICTNHFYNYKLLKSIKLNSNVVSIGSKAFYGCSSLAKVEYEGTMEQWSAVTLGSNWKQGCPFTKVECSDGDVTLQTSDE